MSDVHKIGFGGGCHWCTEAVFQALRGVVDVKQGFVQSDTPDDTWSEAVVLEFDPSIVSIESLVSVHLATHASTSDHKLRGKYRSAVYTFSSEQRELARAAIAKAEQETGLEFVTRVLSYRGFKPSDERFHDYYKTAPDRPFCQTYIDPKLARLRANFSSLLKPSE